MESLGKNWITEKRIDFEYKKYLLLAYLQHVSEEFDGSKLYPTLTELVTHYRNVVSLKENKKALFESFPERMTNADLKSFKLLYERIIADDEIMQEIESIIDFSIPQFEKHLAEGKKIYDYIESNINITPVGIIPLQPNEGYMFLRNGQDKETRIYEYQISVFEQPAERYRGIYAQYICSYEKTLLNTFESIKGDLLRLYKKLANPATYAIETELVLPFEQTLLPMAKRSLVKYVAGKSGN